MEKLLASQDKKIISLSRGQQIEGEIVSKTEKEIILDLGTKSEGVLQARELPQAEKLKVGDKVKAYVVLPENESGQVVLSFSQQFKTPGGIPPRGRGIVWNKFIQAMNQKSKLQGKVLEINKGGLIVEVEGVRGFLPNSQVGFELLSNAGKGMQDLIGQNLNISVIEIDQDENRLIFSQRGQVSDGVKAKLSNFKKDQKVLGKIVAILPFGLVVNVNDAEGLIFISDVSWEKVEDLTKIFQVGLEIEALVSGIDEDLGRLNLSIKHMSEDPFSKLSEQFPADEVVKADVLEISDEGVTVKLKDDIIGFLPAIKMGSTKYEVGQTVTLLVDGLDPKKRRVNLAPLITSTEGLIYK